MCLGEAMRMDVNADVYVKKMNLLASGRIWGHRTCMLVRYGKVETQIHWEAVEVNGRVVQMVLTWKGDQSGHRHTVA